MNNILKYASLLLAAAMLFACDEKSGTDPVVEGGEFRILVDKDVIQSNGTDASTLTVMLGDKDVTAESTIYDAENNVATLNGGKFTTTENGEYKFWATYGTNSTFSKDAFDNGLITIKAIPVPVPAKAKDPQESNLSFKHRVFLIQSTGTACKYCPGMVMIMRKAFDPAKMVLAAVHNFAAGDPAYLAQPSYGALGASGVPSVSIDFASVYGNYTDQKGLEDAISQRYNSTEAKVGISVNSVIEGDYLVARVSVKAAETGTYNVGAWLLEDGIYGKQLDEYGIKAKDPDHNYDNHDNCTRIADSRWNNSFVGFPLGEVEQGKTAEKTFVMNLKKDFKVENLHLAVFVTEASDEAPGHRVSGKYYTMNNVIDCPVGEEVTFEYK